MKDGGMAPVVRLVSSVEHRRSGRKAVVWANNRVSFYRRSQEYDHSQDFASRIVAQDAARRWCTGDPNCEQKPMLQHFSDGSSAGRLGPKPWRVINDRGVGCTARQFVADQNRPIHRLMQAAE